MTIETENYSEVEAAGKIMAEENNEENESVSKEALQDAAEEEFAQVRCPPIPTPTLAIAGDCYWPGYETQRGVWVASFFVSGSNGSRDVGRHGPRWASVRPNFARPARLTRIPHPCPALAALRGMPEGELQLSCKPTP